MKRGWRASAAVVLTTTFGSTPGEAHDLSRIAQAAPPELVPVIPDAPEAPPVPPPEPAQPPAPLPPTQAPARLVPEVDRDAGAEPMYRGRVRHRGDFTLELDVAMSFRLGEGPEFTNQETLGAAYGAGFWWNAIDALSLGFELQHVELGRGDDQDGANLASVEFSTTAAWLSGRFTPIRSRVVDGFLALRAGLALQHVDATGLVQRASALEPAEQFSCTVLDGPGVAFGGGLGARFSLGPRVSLVTRVDANAYRLADGVIDDCAVGVGSTASVGGGVGLSYDFGVDESNARARSSAHAR